MRNPTIHFFFRCTNSNCGAWYCSRKRLKTSKRCIFCNQYFHFENSTKTKLKCTDLEAVAILKYLKAEGKEL